MQFKSPACALVVGSLALMLGVGIPATAFAAETDDASDESRAAVIAQDEEQVIADEASSSDAEAPVDNGVEASDEATVDDAGTTDEGVVTDVADVAGEETAAGDAATAGDDGASDDAAIVEEASSSQTEGAVDGGPQVAEPQASDDQEGSAQEGVAQEQEVPVESSNPASTTKPEAASVLVAQSDVETPAESNATSTPTDGESTNATTEESATSTTTEPEEEVDEGRVIEDGRYTFSSKLKKTMVLNVKDGANKAGTNVQIYKTSGSSAEKWDVRYVSDSLYRIFKAGTKYVLALVNSSGKSGTNVALAKLKKKATTQLWSFVADGSYYKIVSAVNPKLVLDIAGGKAVNKRNVRAYKSNNGKGQRFRLYKVKSAPVSTYAPDNGTYEIVSNQNAEYAVSIKGDSRDNGANTQIGEATHSQAQKFYFTSDGKGYYSIRSIGSGRALAVSNASVIPGNNVIQKKYTGASTQKWSLQETDKGIEIVNKATGLSLTISGSSCANGLNVLGNAHSTKTIQRFTLESTQALADGIYAIYSAKNESKVLGVVGSAVKLNASDGSLEQRFEIVNIGGETYRIRTGASGGYLTSTGSNLKQAGKQATAVSKKNSWELVWNGDYFSLHNLKAKKVLGLKGGKTASGTKAQVYVADKSTAQHFYFTPSNLLADGTYLMNAACDSKKVLEVPKGRKTNNLGLWINAKDGDESQQFIFKSTGSSTNTFVITNAKTRLAISVKNGSKSSKASIVQSKYRGVESQQWTAIIGDGGCVMFVNANSGKVMTLNKNSSANYTKLKQDVANTNLKSQGWKLQLIGWEAKEGNYYYYHDVNGRRTKWKKWSYESWNRIKTLTSKTKYLGAVDRDHTYTTFFIRKGSTWVPYKAWLCSVGGPGVETPAGVHTVWNKSRHEYYEGKDLVSVWYWTHFKNGRAFHSVLCRPDTKIPKWESLGNHNTGGCVRCPILLAKWVYDNVKIGSTICVY